MDRNEITTSRTAQPLCPYFGECGGCLHQDIPYAEELSHKEHALKMLLEQAVPGLGGRVQKIEPSPREYHYRHRLDLRLLKTREQKIFVGFSPQERFGVVDVDQCPIAMEAVSEFIPELKEQAARILPRKYRLANLVVRCGDDGRVRWGGIGKRSLRQAEEEYFWTSLNGLKIYFALDTFFQANLSILPRLLEVIRGLPVWSADSRFLDLYGGVGLFSLGLRGSYGKATLIEDCKNSIRVAHYNVETHGLDDIEVLEGRVEDLLESVLSEGSTPRVAMIDPPRAGLSPEARQVLVASAHKVEHLLYMSCNPEALARDLAELQPAQWQVRRVMPFDFFPKTRHLETLVWLTSAG